MKVERRGPEFPAMEERQGASRTQPGFPGIIFPAFWRGMGSWDASVCQVPVWGENTAYV